MQRHGGAWSAGSLPRAACRPIRYMLLISDPCFAGGFFRERTGIPNITEAYYRRAYVMPSRQAMTSACEVLLADARSTHVSASLLDGAERSYERATSRQRPTARLESRL